MRNSAPNSSAVCSTDRRHHGDLRIGEQPGGVAPRHWLACNPCPYLGDVLAPVRGAGHDRLEVPERGPLRGDLGRGAGQGGHQRIGIGRGLRAVHTAVLDQRQQPAWCERPRRPFASSRRDRASGTPRHEKTARNGSGSSASSNRRSTNFTPARIALSERDQVLAGLDRGHLQASVNQASGQLAGAASDLEHSVARGQAAGLTGQIDQLVRIGRAVAVVLDRHGVEHRSVAKCGRALGHASANLPGGPDDIDVVRRRYHPRTFEVGGDGKPVGIRRGPATVIGDAVRTKPLATTSRREGAAGRPESQETSLRPQSQQPSWKGVALMNRKTLTALVGALVLALAASGVALAAGSGPSVTVQVKTLSKTLLKPTAVHGEKGSDHQGRNAEGQVPGQQRRRGAGRRDPRQVGRQVLSQHARHLHHVDPRGEAPGERLLGDHSSTASPPAPAPVGSSSTPGRSCCSRSPSEPRAPATCMSWRLAVTASAIAVAVALAGCGLGAGQGNLGRRGDRHA